MRRDPTERDLAELDTAYGDGVAELSPDERHRIEARLAGDPAARAELAAGRRLLERMRALPAEGAEPDWTAMERSIRDAVGREVPRPWWRRWTWMAPLTTLVTAAVVLLVVWGRPAPTLRRAVPVLERGEHRLPVAEAAGDDSVALWLDGAEVDVDPAAAEALVAPEAEDGEANEANEVGLLPATDLAWVDSLDDDALDRAEHWLAGKKKG
jgi:anti-sigma factor RsiW